MKKSKKTKSIDTSARKHLYYHVYLTEDHAKWAYPFLEQFKQMEDAGLLDQFDTIDISAITSPTMKLGNFAQLVETYNDKKNISLHVYQNDVTDDANLFANLNKRKDALTENITMQRIHHDANARFEEDDLILYVHAKGLTSVDNHLMRGQAETFKKYFYWRQFLNFGVIEKWKECVNAVSTGFDIAGVNYFTDPVPHFSGTFWWANAKYLRTLPDPSSYNWWDEMKQQTNDQWLKTAEDRFRDELWIGSRPHKVFVPVVNESKRYLSADLLKRNEYA